jgi:hypothetical protein
MPGGGRQPGAGRPKGALSKVTAKAKQAAMETGLLPHEWLLKVSRGEGIIHKRWVVKHDAKGNVRSRELIEEEIYSDFATRLDAAKAAAPFYAPKLAAQTVSLGDGNSNAVAKALTDIAGKLPV